MGKKLTTKEFIERAKLIHGDKYDYSLVEYNGVHNNIDIICPIHKIFQQSPNNHIKGQSCPYCNGRGKLNLERIINQFKKIHSDKYDYSLVEYKNELTKVKIICKEHGEFKLTPNKHKQGGMCQKCSNKPRYNNEKIISEFIKTHGNIYDYSLINYINKITKVKIICHKHGIFEQLPHSHRSGQGCAKCSNKNLTNEERINNFKLVHGNRYNYSLVNYVNNTTPIKIICKNHGIFEQTSSVHLLENGCQKCSESKGEKKVREFLENNNIEYNPQHRFKNCKYKYPLPFDFYLPELNILIEFHGIQHYKVIKAWGGESRFNHRKFLDKIKMEYCDKNNIQLLIIKYDEDIKSKLKGFNII